MQRYERISRMINEINKGRYPSVQDFCRMFEIGERSVYNDLQCLRDYLELEIKFDTARKGYYNPDPTKKLPEFNLSVGEVFALTLGREMLAEYSGTDFEPILSSALDKIADRLPEKVRVDLPNLVSAVRFKTSGVAPITRDLFFAFNKACEDRSIVSIQYGSASTGQTTIRELEPLRLVENRNAWYVLAWCRMRNDLRMFALHRILSYKILADKFAERDVDTEKYLGEAFLLEHGDPPQNYSIKFTPEAARYVRERKWHPSQELVEHKNGSCTLSFTATRLDEVKRWVLGFGASAEVIDPPALQAVMRAELQAAAALYATTGNGSFAKPKKIAASTQKKASPPTGSSKPKP